LVVLFGPEEPAACAREVAAYRQHRDKFARHDAWLLAFTDETIEPPCGPADGRILTIADPDRRAWTAFRDLTRHAEEMDRASGATFLFTRGGGLHRYWHGSGHVDDVLAELRTPSSEHPHQQV
jgi:peroxiredoxin